MLDQLSRIVHGLSEASVLVDAELKLITYNEAFTLLAGMRRRALDAELRQRVTPFEVLGPDATILIENARVALYDAKAVRLHEVHLRSERGESVVSVSLVPLVQSPEPPYLLVTFRDVTAEAHLQTRYKELIALERARGDELERAVAARTQELRAALEEVTRLSRTDPLTGLLNRRSFLELAENSLELARRHGRCAAFLVCDLDFFKHVNDSYGHDAGDRVLVAAAKALQDSLRKTDQLGRFGGEEFVILLAETDRGMVQAVAERFVAAVRTIPMPEIAPGSRGPQTISIGAAIFPDHGASSGDVISRADQALYAAKHRGRNQAVLFESKLASTEVPEALPGALWCSLRTPPDELRSHYDLTVVDSCAEALQNMQCGTYDAVIIDAVGDDGRGTEIIQHVAVMQPNAVRAMLVSSTRDYVSLRSAVFGAADLFMLNEDVAELPHALEDARARRQARKPMSRGLHVWQTRGRKQTRQEVERVCRESLLHLVYQPIVRLVNDGRLGVEALSRVESEAFQQPADLFEAALEADMLWSCSRLVRRRIAEDIGKLPADELVFMNLHPADFDDPEFVAEDSALAPFRKRIVLELTERATVPNFERFAEYAAELRRKGFRIAVDDLGAGYASLNSLALIEPDFIKIDMSITRGITIDNVRGKLVRRIVEFANDSRAQVIIEGVETEAEASVVRTLGCHFGQGFFFAQPARL